MEIIETVIFEKDAARIFSEDEYSSLISYLAVYPDAGRIIPGARGLRKLRWGSSGRGKQGGARVIYYWYVPEEQVFLLCAYRKADREDLTTVQLKQLRELIGE